MLPGIYIGLRLSFYKQAILINRSSVTAAFRESLRRTTGWRIPLVLLLLLTPFYGLSILAVYVVGTFSLGLVGEGLLLGVSALTFTWTNTFLTSLYLSNQEFTPLRSR
jgi:membrane-anchored glycerophosphoryl diester phosphodiesterase (GDPDase)